MAINWDFFVQPFGIPIALTWTQFFGALTMVNRYPPALFIELGVYRGGLGSLLITRCKYDPNFHYLGIEIDQLAINKTFFQMVEEEPRAEIYIGDLYKDETEKYVDKRIMNAAGRTIIFCDGGEKLLDIVLYSELLKRTGDILFAHDYPGQYDDEDLEFMFERFDALDEEFFKNGLLIPAFIRK